MPIVDLSNWHFSFGGSPRQLAGTTFYEAPETIEFGKPIELLRHLAEDGTRDSSFQSQIRARLKNDAVAKNWHRLRTKIGDTTHFKVYRKNPHYERYHAAAIAVANGPMSYDQKDLAQGLDDEITASRVIVPAGQVLFHGRGDLNLHMSLPYPSFVSTSLDPTVCVYHAVKRKLKKGTGATAVIYALTLREPLPAMWGNGGGLEEWELLLQSKLTCTVTARYTGRRFDTVEATIGH